MVQLACSDLHYLALTTDGQVYSSGGNGAGQLGLKHQNEEKELKQVALRSGHFATFVACGASHSIVISEQESVHYFGLNDNYQLGYGNPGRYPEPTVLVLKDYQVIKACCGRVHSLFLTSTGSVLAAGNGQNAQLGKNLRSNHPAQLVQLPSSFKGRVIDIFAHPSLDVSVLVDAQGIFHVSGKAGELLGTSGIIEDFFPLKLSSVVVDTQIVCAKPETHSFCARFDDPACCDIQIASGEDGPPIHFGWDTIRARSPYLTALVNSNMQGVKVLDDGRKRVKLENYQQATLRAYGSYLHAGSLSVDESPETLLELLKLADEYQDETGLHGLCGAMLNHKVTSENVCRILEPCIRSRYFGLGSNVLKQGLALSNVCDILNVAAAAEDVMRGVHDGMAKTMVAYIKDITLAFATRHATQVVKDPKFKELQPRMAKEFLSKLAEMEFLKT